MVKVKTLVFIKFNLNAIELGRVSYIKLFTQFSYDFCSLNGFFFLNSKDVGCKNRGVIGLKSDNSKKFVIKKEV